MNDLDYFARKLEAYEGKNGKNAAVKFLKKNNQREIADLICDEEFVEYLQTTKTIGVNTLMNLISNTKDLGLVKKIGNEIDACKGKVSIHAADIALMIKDKDTLDNIFDGLHERDDCKEYIWNITKLAGCIDGEILQKTIAFVSNWNCDRSRLYDNVLKLAGNPKNLPKAIEVLQQDFEVKPSAILCTLAGLESDFEIVADYYLKYPSKINSTINHSISRVEAHSEYTTNLISLFEAINDRGDLTEVAKVFEHLDLDKSYHWINIMHIFRKYDDKCMKDLIPKYFIQSSYDELLSDFAYNQIKKSKKPAGLVERILHQNYSLIRKRVKIENLSYDEMDKVANTYRFVLEIHKKRPEELKKFVRKGFYVELNRSISQVDSRDEKINIMKTYCREVVHKMKEYASELMVVRNV